MENEKSYCNTDTDPDSYKAFYELDPGDLDELVEVNDEHYTFTWYRGKSNDNLKDTRHGKEGFSFYLARHVYHDRYRIYDSSLSSDINNIGVIGLVEGDKKEMIVINVRPSEDEPWIIHIVSAYYTSNPRLIKDYRINKAQIKLTEKAIEKMSDEKIKRLRENIERRQKYLDSFKKS